MHKNPALARGWGDGSLNLHSGEMSAIVAEQLRAFYVENRQSLYTYAVSLAGRREAAEDAMHQVFQRLLSRDRLPEELRPYVFRCVRNAVLDQRRRAAIRQGQAAGGPEPADTRTPDAILQARELDAKLWQLSPDEREAIVLKIYDGFTFQEIADLRGQPLPTVASWYRRGLGKLRELMAPTHE